MDMNTIDLFSGAGGLSLGLTQAGAKIAACVEINRDAIDTYAAHTHSEVYHNTDVRNVDFLSYRGKVNLVSGGPPCQPFSLGGLRKGKDDERDMIPEFFRCLEECQPDNFLMENVPGLLAQHTRSYFDSVIRKFIRLGYFVNWTILNSADYGVVQKRRRLFVMGSKHMMLRFPAPMYGAGTARPHLRSRDIIGGEPIGEVPNCPVRYAKYPDLRPSPYAGHIYNGGGRPIDPDGPCHTILASSGGYKTHWVDTLSIAPEYHAHLRAGGAPYEGIVPGARRLSVEECAAVQSFPREIRFLGKRSSQYKQVGDAVPPQLAFIIGTAVFAQLRKACQDVELLEPDAESNTLQSELFI